MDNLAFSFNVIFPLFVLLFLGNLSVKMEWINKTTLNALNKFIFRLPLPLLLFLSIYNMDDVNLAESFKMIIILIVGLPIITLFISLILNKKSKLPNSQKGVLVQAWFRSNIIIFGVPVIQGMYGDKGLPILGTLVLFAVPLVNILAVFVLEGYRGHDTSLKALFIGVLKNPLVDAALIGIIFYLTKIQIPSIILTPLTSLSKTATPLAFIILGGTLEFDSIRKNIKLIIFGGFGKLIITPLFIVSIAVALGLRDMYLGCLLTATASPVAVSSFTMAKEMEGDADLAAQLVILTTVVSLVTLFTWLFILKSLALI